jgi:hypothetical protein
LCAISYRYTSDNPRHRKIPDLSSRYLTRTFTYLSDDFFLLNKDFFCSTVLHTNRTKKPRKLQSVTFSVYFFILKSVKFVFTVVRALTVSIARRSPHVDRSVSVTIGNGPDKLTALYRYKAIPLYI